MVRSGRGAERRPALRPGDRPGRLVGPRAVELAGDHAAAGVGQVDIWNIPETGDPTPLVTDLDYADAADPVNLPTGTYTIGIDATVVRPFNNIGPRQNARSYAGIIPIIGSQNPQRIAEGIDGLERCRNAFAYQRIGLTLVEARQQRSHDHNAGR